jgi:hypothetical protein
MFSPTERSGDLVIAGVLFCIGLIWIIGSLGMPRGEFAVPGPGFFPTMLGTLMCVASFALGLHTLLVKSTQRVRIGHPYIWSTIMAMLMVSIVFERLGFIATMALFVGFFLKLLSGLRWIPCTAFSIAAAVGAYLFFNLLLGIQLPFAHWF